MQELQLQWYTTVYIQFNPKSDDAGHQSKFYRQKHSGSLAAERRCVARPWSFVRCFGIDQDGQVHLLSLLSS